LLAKVVRVTSYKICNSCKESLPIETFRWSMKCTGQRHTFCRPCEWQRNRDRRKAKTEKVRAYKLEKGCKNCGYKKCPSALQLHHRDPTTKSSSVKGRSAYHHEWGWSRIKAELEKCDVLCANCHAEEHYEEN